MLSIISRANHSLLLPRRGALVLVCVMMGAACSEVGGAEYARAMSVKIGVSEADAIGHAGAPSRVAKPPRPSCTQSGVDRELVYELRTVRLWGAISDTVSSQVMLCVNQDSKVVQNSIVEF